MRLPPGATAKTAAAIGVTAPVTIGRCRVRCMTASMSRSTTMLAALAPPAERAPPTRVATISHHFGIPRSATTIVGSVVTRSSSMIRGLVSATYALSLKLIDRRGASAVVSCTIEWSVRVAWSPDKPCRRAGPERTDAPAEWWLGPSGRTIQERCACPTSHPPPCARWPSRPWSLTRCLSSAGAPCG